MVASGVIRRAYVDVGAGSIHYRYGGDERKPTLLMLHQSPSSSAMYEPLMGLLAQDFRMLAPDTPGFGGSDSPASKAAPIEIGDYADAIHGFLEALGVATCCVFGHHTGASIAVQLEHDFPGTAAAMVLSGPPLLNAGQKKSLPELAAPIPVLRDGSHLGAMWRRISAKDPEAPVELLQREVESALVSGDNYQASYRAVCEQPFALQLTGLDCPVLVFAGDSDPLYSAVEPSLELLRFGEKAELPGGERTYVCERQAGLVANVVRDFIGGHHRSGTGS